MKKQYFLVLDVETANSTTDALVYDVGIAVADRYGKIFESASYIVSDIFFKEADLMKTAYYHEKVPSYLKGIWNGDFKVATFFEVRQDILTLIDNYNIRSVCAYNANFDTSALNTTQRFLTSSKLRYFLPYGVEVNCIWNMACQVICTQKSYIKWCLKNDFISPSGNIKTSAECVYSYITKNPKFDEAHTGLQDVLIETQILAKCFAQHKKMERKINRTCWRIPQKIKKEMGV